MKNQYVGDIGDYGKYGLLRYLAGRGIRIGVNWYLTEDDGSEDGKFTDYLKDGSEYREYDPILFDQLKQIVSKGKGSKRVQDIKENCIITNTVFFDEMLVTTIKSPKERKSIREGWHNRAKETLDNNCDLIFADPDNGTIKYGRSTSVKNGEKYAVVEELQDYYEAGKDIVYYCHKERRSEMKWNEKKSEFHNACPDAKIIVLTFHRGTQRSYIFAIHPERYDEYNNMINEFLETKWGIYLTKGKRIPPFERELTN